MNAPDPGALDRRSVARSFDRAAPEYEQAATLQQRVRAELLERLSFFTLTPSLVLDLGAGTCQALPALQRRYPRARVLAADIAPGMLQQAPRRRWPARAWSRVCADAYGLPLADASVDLIYSNLMLQWCDRLDDVFAEAARVLRPEGVFVFSSFGPDTLLELRQAWSAADSQPHVSQFVDMPQLGDALMHVGLREPVLDVEHHRLFYPDSLALMRALKVIGAHNALQARSRGLMGRHRLQRMQAAYETLRDERGLPATYEVIFGAVFGRTAPLTAGGAPGESVVPLSQLRRRAR